MASNTDRIVKLEKEVRALKESNRVQLEILGQLSEVAKGQTENYPQIMSLIEVATGANDAVGAEDEAVEDPPAEDPPAGAAE